MVTPLIQHHKQSGRIPHPLWPENSSRIGEIIHSHLSGMRSSQSLLNYLTRKLGPIEAQNIMQTTGSLNPMIIQSIKSNLPPPDLLEANREMPSLTGLQQFSYLRNKFELLLEDVRLMGTANLHENSRDSTQNIVIGAAAYSNSQTAMPGHQQTNYPLPPSNQAYPSPPYHNPGQLPNPPGYKTAFVENTSNDDPPGHP